MKTLFIPISSNAVFRNLFLFPGSVFQTLKEYANVHPEFRIVLLQPEREYNKYNINAMEGFETHYFTEAIHATPPRGLVQKFFHFLYSYLLYTRTTMVLATMGTRPGEPPAGGRRLLAPLKWLTSRTLGRSRYIRLTAVPWLFQHIFTDRPFKDVFDRHEPTLVFATHLYGWFDALLLAEARRRGIKTIGMPAGWDHLDKYYLPFHVDRLLVPSEEIRRSAVTYQSYHPQDMTLVGYPHFDYIISRPYEIPREELLKQLEFPSDTKIILYVSGSEYCPDETDIVKTMMEWANEGELKGNVYFAIRPYPGGRSKSKEYDKVRFEPLAQSPRVRLCWQKVWTDNRETEFFMNIMRHADIVIQVYTTVALEAVALDRPILSTLFDGHRLLPFHQSIRRFEEFEHFQDVIKTGALARAHDFAELKQLLNIFLTNPNYLRKERGLMKKELCGPLDGKASERIVKEIMTFFL